MLVTTFDHDPHPQIGLTPTDAAGRLQLQGKIAGYAPNPNGWTAIGEALKSAHDQLQPVTDYDIKATVLLTDGRENHGPHDRLSIDDVSGVINEHTFAFGLGVPGEIDPARLMQLCANNQGYMLGRSDRLSISFVECRCSAMRRSAVVSPPAPVLMSIRSFASGDSPASGYSDSPRDCFSSPDSRCDWRICR
jgi:hypothetical protein